MLPRSFNWIIFLYYALAAKLRAEQKFFHTLLLVLYKEDLKFVCAVLFHKETPAFQRVLSKFCVWVFFDERDFYLRLRSAEVVAYVCLGPLAAAAGWLQNVLY